MKRTLVGIIALAAVLAGCTSRPDTNVILISLDTVRADHLSLHGYSRPTSPNLDRFASGAAVFDQSFANGVYTPSSHMTMLTGLYPIAHQVFQPAGSARKEHEQVVSLSRGIKTLPEVLRGNGYLTARFVNSRDYFLDGGLGFDRGFDENHPYGLDAQWSADRIADWIGKRRNEKFFAFIHSKRPHLPYSLPAPYDRLFDPDYKGRILGSESELEGAIQQRIQNWFLSSIPGIFPEQVFFLQSVNQEDPADLRHLVALYDGALVYTDVLLGKILRKLEEKKLLQNTLIVITSDHGEEFLDHGGLAHLHPYREILHVPLVIRMPGAAAGQGKRFGGPVESADIFPTVLDLLKIASPHPTSGRSLLPLLSGREWSPREHSFAQHRYKGLPGQDSVRTRDWKLILDDTGKAELYDLKADPLEKKDVSSSRPEIVQKLKQALKGQDESARRLREALSEKEK